MLLNLDRRFPRTNRIPPILRYTAEYAFNQDRVVRASVLAALKFRTNPTNDRATPTREVRKEVR